MLVDMERKNEVLKNKDMIFVTGCTGYIGSRLCRRLLACKYRVGGLIKPSEGEKAKPLIDMGLIPFYGDLTTLTALPHFSNDIHIIYHMAGGHSTYDNAYALYVQGTAKLLQSFSPQQNIAVIAASNGAVYNNTAGIKQLPDHSFGRITLEMERIIRKFCNKHAILRIGEVYGDGEANPFVHAQNKLVLIGNGMNYASKIHIEDLLNILTKYIDVFPFGTYNVCDDEPVRQIDFYHYVEKLSRKRFVCLRQDIELSERIAYSIHGLRTLNIAMSNKKIKNALNYKFVFPTYRHGLQYLYKNTVDCRTSAEK